MDRFYPDPDTIQPLRRVAPAQNPTPTYIPPQRRWTFVQIEEPEPEPIQGRRIAAIAALNPTAAQAFIGRRQPRLVWENPDEDLAVIWPPGPRKVAPLAAVVPTPTYIPPQRRQLWYFDLAYLPELEPIQGRRIAAIAALNPPPVVVGTRHHRKARSWFG